MLVLSEDQRMLMESARGAVAANASISTFRKLRSDPAREGFSRAFWGECAKMGWTGVLVPEEFGGIDFGIIGAGLIAREMARTLAPSPFLSTAVIAANALRGGGSAEQKKSWLPRIAKGEAIVGAALEARADPAGVKATRVGAGWRLDGVKHQALDGHVADALLIAAEIENGGTTLFLAPATANGLKRDARTLVDGRRVASLRLEDATLAADAALGGGAATLEATLDVARAVAAAALCGVAEEAFARTMGYLKERKQFERRIGSFQALQHRAARMHIDIENSWSATLKALESLAENSNSAALDVAVAKAKASDAACAATAECLQMHGGIGMTDEFDIGLFLKRARVDAVMFGDAAFHADRVATMLGY
jgi:alkylation response protein AidB-like acyl-CoA dehydrogenase